MACKKKLPKVTPGWHLLEWFWKWTEVRKLKAIVGLLCAFIQRGQCALLVGVSVMAGSHFVWFKLVDSPPRISPSSLPWCHGGQVCGNMGRRGAVCDRWAWLVGEIVGIEIEVTSHLVLIAPRDNFLPRIPSNWCRTRYVALCLRFSTMWPSNSCPHQKQISEKIVKICI